MCTGATSGLAGLKFSTSPNIFGLFDDSNIIKIISKIMGIVSFVENKGLNFTLSNIVEEFEGLDEPFSCSRIKCTNTRAAITIGKIKCNEKNRFSVGWETDGPPQIHVVRSFPTIGIADSTPVITVAPQNDICPHGKTYPKKAVAIIARSKMIPEIHTLGLFPGEEKYIPRAV